jgi:hypothetical protein
MTNDNSSNVLPVGQDWRAVLADWLAEDPVPEVAVPFVGFVAHILDEQPKRKRQDEILTPIAIQCQANPQHARDILRDAIAEHNPYATFDSETDELSTDVPPVRSGVLGLVDRAIATLDQRFGPNAISALKGFGAALAIAAVTAVPYIQGQRAKLAEAKTTIEIITELRPSTAPAGYFLTTTMIGEIYRLEGQTARFLIDVGDWQSTAAFYDCKSPTEEMIKVTRDLQGARPPLNLRDITLECTFLSEPEFKLAKVVKSKPSRRYNTDTYGTPWTLSDTNASEWQAMTGRTSPWGPANTAAGTPAAPQGVPAMPAAVAPAKK